MVLPGVTVIAVAVDPVFQLYVPPPLAVNMVLPPLQIVVVPLIVGVKPAPTITSAVADPVHPAILAVTV